MVVSRRTPGVMVGPTRTHDRGAERLRGRRVTPGPLTRCTPVSDPTGVTEVRRLRLGVDLERERPTGEEGVPEEVIRPPAVVGAPGSPLEATPTLRPGPSPRRPGRRRVLSCPRVSKDRGRGQTLEGRGSSGALSSGRVVGGPSRPASASLVTKRPPGSSTCVGEGRTGRRVDEVHPTT